MTEVNPLTRWICLLVPGINKAAYTEIGINLEGIKEVLGIWVGENESPKY